VELVKWLNGGLVNWLIGRLGNYSLGKKKQTAKRNHQ
jgi:membrane protein YqaA with SNARE-associated domain